MQNLGEVGRLAAALTEAEREVEAAESALKVAKERQRKIAEEDLPSAMEEVGLKEVKLPDGSKIAVKQDVYVAIPSLNREACWTWLDEHGHGGLIKTQIVAQFGRGEEQHELMQQVMQALMMLNVDATPKQDVHAQTLKAWFREQLQDAEKAAVLPLDLFGARPVTVATVTKPKTKI